MTNLPQGQEVICKWRDLINVGCTVSFNRVVFDERHGLSATYANVEHPTNKFESIQFRATPNCDSWMTSRVDDRPQTLSFLADVKVNFTSRPLCR